MSEIEQLKKQLSALEKRVVRLENGANDSPFFEHKKEKVKPSEPSQFNLFIDWLKEDWLMKLGAFLLLLGLSWFVYYSFDQGWIGPIGRISLGVLASAGVMAAGHFTFEKKPNPGKVLIALGGVGILLTLFASRVYYENMLSAPMVFSMMTIVVAAMAGLAILHDARSLAITALLGGALVPVLVQSPSSNYLVLLSYILILNIGTILVATMKGWRSMVLLALLVTGMYSTAMNDVSEDYIKWLFMAAYFLLFLFSNLAAILRTNQVRKTNLFISGINGLLLLGWAAAFVPDEWVSLVLTGVVLLMTGISYVLMRNQKMPATLLHAALGVLFLGAATAFELHGEALVIAFSIEALLVTILAYYALENPKATNYVSLLQVVPALMTMEYVDRFDINADSLFNSDFFVILIATVSLGLTAYVLTLNKKKEGVNYFAVFQSILAVCFAIMLIWLSSYQIFESNNLSKGVALVIYTLSGMASWVYGLQDHRKPFKIAGNVLLAGVVLRLLFVEVWDMSLLGRVVTFVAIGILLVSTAFLEKSKTRS